MRTILNSIPSVLSLMFALSVGAQTKRTLPLSDGAGWYRIISGTASNGGGMVRVSGTGGDNRQTRITMDVSLMRYGQGGSINIRDNVFYNLNHIDSIRGGSVGKQEYVVDVHVVMIGNPTNLTVEVDNSSLPIVESAIYDPTPPDGNIVEISGRVIGAESKRWPIYFGPNVGIGTRETFGYTLAVNGEIGAKEVKVEVSSAWPDHVFTPDHSLTPLDELDAYIEENGHLPDIPPAEEVEENGIMLGEMDARLLQKIEELTLYLIEEHKDNQRLLEEVEQLKAQNSKLIERIEKIVSSVKK